MFKKTNEKGFTLVEVIVVAIIVAILAVAAVPIYQKYITSSMDRVAASAAADISTQIAADFAETGSVFADLAAVKLGCKPASGITIESYATTGTQAIVGIKYTKGKRTASASDTLKW